MPQAPPPTLPPPERFDALRLALLAWWAMVAFGSVFAARLLDRVVWGWPLNFWLAAQGIVLCFVAIVGGYAWVANRADRAAQSQPETAAHLPS